MSSPFLLQDKSMPVSWLGAASFEERSVGSLHEMVRLGIPIQEVALVVYETDVSPSSVGEGQRLAHISEMSQLARRGGARTVEQIRLPAYSYGAAQGMLRQQFDGKAGRIVVDVSCLTKIHTIALAAWLTRAACEQEIWLVYTSPENYPGIPQAGGWRDIIVTPLSGGARLFNETTGRGLILVGHEADRLIVALAEIEPAGGSIVMASSLDRPDLTRVSARRNRGMVRHLESARPGAWRRARVGLTDFRRVASVVGREVSLACSQSNQRAPVFLFPYGPKPLVLAMGFELAGAYMDNAWLIYPIPMGYDVTYSEGISEVLWFRRG